MAANRNPAFDSAEELGHKVRPRTDEACSQSLADDIREKETVIDMVDHSGAAHDERRDVERGQVAIYGPRTLASIFRGRFGAVMIEQWRADLLSHPSRRSTFNLCQINAQGSLQFFQASSAARAGASSSLEPDFSASSEHANIAVKEGHRNHRPAHGTKSRSRVHYDLEITTSLIQPIDPTAGKVDSPASHDLVFGAERE